MGAAYLDAVRLGKNSFWRYLLSAGVILFFAAFIGALPLLVAALVAMADGDPATGVNMTTGMLVGVDPLLTFPLLMASFVAMALGIVIAVRVIHDRPLVTLIDPERRVRWGRLAQGFGLWLLLAAALAVVEALLFPGRYRWSLDLAHFLPFSLMALVLIPIQTSSEELLFRGYTLQGLGLRTRNPILLSAASGLLFALPHFANPEVGVDFWPVMAYYFIFGAGMAWFTLRDNGLELALGVHAANNLFASMLANYSGSALATPAVFTAASFDPWYNLLSGLAALLVFFLVVFRPWQRPLVLAEAASGED